MPAAAEPPNRKNPANMSAMDPRTAAMTMIEDPMAATA
jgi:hypothetical protein